MKKIAILIVLLLAALVLLAGCQNKEAETQSNTAAATPVPTPETEKAKYDRAMSLFAQNKYAEAAAVFDELGGYEESTRLAMYCKAADAGEKGNYNIAISGYQMLEDFKESKFMITYYEARRDEDSASKNPEWAWRSWISAAGTYDSISLFRDSGTRAEACRKAAYDYAVQLGDAKDYESAVNVLDALGSYSDCVNLGNYYAAFFLEQQGYYSGASAVFSAIHDYRDAGEQAEKVLKRGYDAAAAKREAQDWDGAVVVFDNLGDYSDAKEQINATRYAEAESLEASGKQGEAYELFISLGNYSNAFERANKPYYEEGIARREAGEWDAAVAAFEHAGDYSDAKEQINETRYQQAKDLMDKGDYAGALNVFSDITGYKDVDNLLAAAFREAKIAPYKEAGTIVTFGAYPQTAEGNDQTPIEWVVLDYDKTNHRALLLSRYGLEAKPYNTKDTDITWETCTLRAWLNSEFLNNAFSKEEQSAILLTEVNNSSGQGYWDTSGGNNTQDRVFLLSYAEANRYLGVRYWEKGGANQNMKSRVAPTDYAMQNGAFTSRTYKTADGAVAGYWWLRSPDFIQYHAALVNIDGSLNSDDVNVNSVSVRPAFWLNLESGIF